MLRFWLESWVKRNILYTGGKRQTGVKNDSL